MLAPLLYYGYIDKIFSIVYNTIFWIVYIVVIIIVIKVNKKENKNERKKISIHFLSMILLKLSMVVLLIKISNIDKTIIGCITPKNNLMLNFEDQNTLQNFCNVTCIPKNELVDMDIFGPKLCYKFLHCFGESIT